ncbi:DNA polymerase/3'-5' exonuclease PolX [Taibaiella lutea]|uniref:DNA polymerase/3'-5' exonuclease PolX n=1 Tax=Taibaiella lutea TaxID=2608001 RepID=A0A5M6CGM2_9BACT|nr:helix-hairpin-helix domain-containing protein [Taibaiella lutea]KAA5533580.1 DNA polymerase/3'-5' exonuclease PolX [Taibaiella lutea]
MSNQIIADIFDLLAKLMEIHGENSFKVKTYSIAAFRLEKIADQVALMTPEQMSTIPNIGAAVVQKIQEILETGGLAVLQEYLEKTPPGVVEMLSIKGIGPKKIALLWKELGAESIGELEYACNENRLVALKGFGAKTQESILKSIAFIRSNQGFCLWSEAETFATQIWKKLRTVYPDNQTDYTGDYRRQMPTMSSIDFITDLSIEQLKAQLGRIPEVSFTEEATQLSVHIPNAPLVLFQLCNAEEFLLHQFYSSASPAFLEAFDNKFKVPEIIRDEAEIFTQNKLQYIPPYLRETTSILEKAATQELPMLIQPGDIKGIIHNHSTYSDGIHTLEQMANATRDKGYEYLVISDHSKTASYAGGLQVEKVMAQHEEIEKLNQKMAPFKIFKSIESDILGDGSLDYEPEVLATFDLVVASVHSNLKMTEEKAMQRLLTAIQNQYTTILGHPTGRLLLSREGYPVDYKLLIDACVAHNVVIEINAHPRRLDLDWSWLSYAMEQGAMVSIDPDAHSMDGIDLVKYGVLASQKGGLTKERNLSSMGLAEFERFLAERKK